MPTLRSEVDEILAATSARAFFGDNEKRAAIKYRRLARAVHPDTGGSDAAMAKLNSMWAEYQAKDETNGKRSLDELGRGNVYAVFVDGDDWLVVRRRPGGVAPSMRTIGLSEVVEGSPVCVLGWKATKSIVQRDGTHLGFVCSQHHTLADGIVMLPSLAEHLPDGTIHPADFAWITKRVIYLAAAVGKCGLKFVEEPCECLAIAPVTHMLCVVAPWALDETDAGSIADQRKVISSYAKCVRRMLGAEKESMRIYRFLEGILVDSFTESSDLMDEFDELLIELFGGFMFHKMLTV